MDGIIPSSVTQAVGLSDDSGGVEGIITDSSITHADMRAGKYFGARIDEYKVDWRVPWAGPIRTDVFWLANLEYDGETWRGDTEGLTRLLKQRFGDTCTRNCKWDLGRDRFGRKSLTEGCKYDVVSTTKFHIEIATVVDARKQFTVTGSGFGLSDFYNLGRIEFVAGTNEGHVNQIADWVFATKTVTLQVRTPYDIEVGDRVDMEPGCDKIFSTCDTKFSNGINFRGFLFIPGLDKSLQAPVI